MTDSDRDPESRDFTLDRFQTEAIAAIDDGLSVVVAAPTGSGKTVVAEHAVRDALRTGGKAFYTTPIKALSNQKYVDLVAELGVENVGLLTGDTSRNGEAPVVVMTTEVLRNMLYEQSPTLDGLRWVVMDEIHYLSDPFRGPVWEEIIIHLPASVRLVGLSATVSNIHDLSGWISGLRGPTATVVETKRPVDLHNHYAGHRKSDRQTVMIPTLVKGKPNRRGHDMDGGRARSKGERPKARYGVPRRLEVLDLLKSEGFLPAIYFIFSRAGCDEAAKAVFDAGGRFTSRDKQAQIDEIIERRTRNLTDADLLTLDVKRWSERLRSGIASHHAGMVPPFKEAVEECFTKGLVQVVFATETLALGINMPARSVVIEKPTKYNGERHELLTPAQYTQLTGRAGRRGIDDVGYALVLWSPFVSFEQVAALAASTTYELESAFRPTYNMAVNLVDRYDESLAHEIIRRSFAQYLSDQRGITLGQRADRLQRDASELRNSLGDQWDEVVDYQGAVARHRSRQSHSQSARRSIESACADLRPGSVVHLGNGMPVVVTSVANRSGGRVRVRALGKDRSIRNLSTSDFADAPTEIGFVELPTPYAPRTAAFQSAVLEGLSAVALRDRAPQDRGPAPEDFALHNDPDRRRLLKLADEVRQLQQKESHLRERTARQEASMVRRLDSVLSILADGGYVEGWTVSERGRTLRRIYHECDLLIAEALAQGLFDGLNAADLAALVSSLVYESRSTVPDRRPWFPSPDVAQRFEVITQICGELNDAETDANVPLTREPDPGLIPAAHSWTLGLDLGDVLEDEDITPGDFVRNLRQLIDLLRQLGEVAPNATTAATAREAAESIQRGVVAASAEATEEDQ